jgi:hypothetical protein
MGKQALKEPKTFNRPRMYARIPTHKKVDLEDCRIRIIYPNGKAEYTNCQSWDNWYRPCWNVVTNTGRRRAKNGEHAVMLMKAFDFKFGHTSLFLGEL